MILFCSHLIICHIKASTVMQELGSCLQGQEQEWKSSHIKKTCKGPVGCSFCVLACLGYCFMYLGV